MPRRLLLHYPIHEYLLCFNVLLPRWYCDTAAVPSWLLLFDPIHQRLLHFRQLLPFRYDCPAAVPSRLVLRYTSFSGCMCRWPVLSGWLYHCHHMSTWILLSFGFFR